ncbi:hypothetical protein J7L67_01845, partial [bacterium]|nr:hypothetical protein [bacterium]
MMREFFKKIYSAEYLFLPLLLLSSAVLIVYLNVSNAGFVYDDNDFIVDNYPVKTWLLKNPWDFFLKPEQAVWSGIYRPLRTLAFAVDYQFFGLNPSGYHIENFFLHIFNAILVFFLFRIFFKNDKISFMGALLFAVHPVQIESVTWISSRGDLLYSFFTLICFIWFLKMAKKDNFSIRKIF